MAGFVFTLGDIASLRTVISQGIFGPYLRKEPTERWYEPHEGTFGDFATMKPGDNVYFFSQRRIYGIGELVNLNAMRSYGCRFLNFPEANMPESFAPRYSELSESLLINEGIESLRMRWVCLFQPSPHFFSNGVDMDETLLSRPQSFRMLRAFENRSFIKIDDEENQALKDMLLRKNESTLTDSQTEGIFPSNYLDEHSRIERIIVQNPEGYRFKLNDFIPYEDSGEVKHEAALEAGLLFQLAQNDPSTIEKLGKLDFISHQVIASPFKPIQYIDRMDIFGYRYISGYPSTISKYCVIELKKGQAEENNIAQVMKYVDWIRDEYAGGDYSMIEAYLVAFEFPQEIFNSLYSSSQRNYTVGTRPAVSKGWSELKLLTYRFDPVNNYITLNEPPQNLL